MKWIHKKLNSKSGISLAISLVFFLLCAMVGTVVLSAASVSAGNTARERQLYRQTLALTSAANVLSRDIQGMTFTGSYERVETVTTTIHTEEGQNTTVETVTTYRKCSGDSAPKLENSALFRIDDLNLAALYYSSQNRSWEGETNLLAQPPELAETHLTFGPVEEEGIPEAVCTLTVGNDYTITALLVSGENSLTMTFPPDTAVKTTNQAPTVSGDGSVKTTVATYTTTLTWGQPSMRKGGAA